jgi:hypothetical protein
MSLLSTQRRAAGSIVAVLAVPVLAASVSTPAFSLAPLQICFRAHHPLPMQTRCGSRTFALRRLCAASHDPFSNSGSVKNSADAPPAPRPAWQRSWRGKSVAGSRAETPVTVSNQPGPGSQKPRPVAGSRAETSVAVSNQPGPGSQKPSPEAAKVDPLAVERLGAVHDLRDAAFERKRSRQEELSASFIDRRNKAECAKAPPPPRHSLNSRQSPSVAAFADAGDGAAVLQVGIPCPPRQATTVNLVTSFFNLGLCDLSAAETSQATIAHAPRALFETGARSAPAFPISVSPLGTRS